MPYSKRYSVNEVYWLALTQIIQAVAFQFPILFCLESDKIDSKFNTYSGILEAQSSCIKRASILKKLCNQLSVYISTVYSSNTSNCCSWNWIATSLPAILQSYFEIWYRWDSVGLKPCSRVYETILVNTRPFRELRIEPVGKFPGGKFLGGKIPGGENSRGENSRGKKLFTKFLRQARMRTLTPVRLVDYTTTSDTWHRCHVVSWQLTKLCKVHIKDNIWHLNSLAIGRCFLK